MSWNTCTLDTCPIEDSVFEYRPSLAANTAFIVLFGLGIVAHSIIGFRWRTWTFTICIIAGCIIEMIGYGGRVQMWQNPFNFNGFIMQIVCITMAPVFFSASIYITLYKTIRTLQPGLARFQPKWYYVWFIVCDIISLVLQAVGGAMSSQSNGSSQNGVNIALAGLSFQVFTLTIFIYLSLDYAWRYSRATKLGQAPSIVHEKRVQIFVAGWTLATICVYMRCCYRVAELSQGYGGPLLKRQGLFIGLEGVIIVLAVFFLLFGHPGFGLKHLTPAVAHQKRVSDVETSSAEKVSDEDVPKA